MLKLVMLRLRSSWPAALFHIVLTGTTILIPWRETELSGFSGWLAPFLVFIFTPSLLQSLSTRDQNDFGNPSLAFALPIRRKAYLGYRILVPVIILTLTVLFALLLALVLPHLLPPKEAALFILVPDHLGFVLSWWLVVLGIHILMEMLMSPAFRIAGFVCIGMVPLLGMLSPLGSWFIQGWQQIPVVDIPWFPDPWCLAFALAATGLAFGLQGRRLAPPGLPGARPGIRSRQGQGA